MEIKQLHREDPDALFLSVQSLFADMHVYMGSVGLTHRLTADGSDMWVDATRKGLGKLNALFIVIEEKRVCAFASGSIRLMPPFLGGQKFGLVSYLYVDPKWRGNGVARRLAETLENWFRNESVSHVELEVLPQNELGIEFWNRLGFQTSLLKMYKQ